MSKGDIIECYFYNGGLLFSCQEYRFRFVYCYLLRLTFDILSRFY